jgi:hypothetical protein
VLEHVAGVFGSTQLQPCRLELAFAFLHGGLRGGEQSMLVPKECGQASDERPYRLPACSGVAEHLAARQAQAIGGVASCGRTRRFD